MNDIFLSYSSQDRRKLRPLVHALEEQGWSVFWDPSTAVGETWSEVIDKEIFNCLSIIVIWSRHSAGSISVYNAAREGEHRGILFSVLLDDIPTPLGFHSIQSFDFSNWDGSDDHPGYKLLIHELTEHFQSIRNQEKPEGQKSEEKEREAWEAEKQRRLKLELMEKFAMEKQAIAEPRKPEDKPEKKKSFIETITNKIIHKKSKARIFISYRRQDTQGIAGRIYDRLVIAYGEDNVFKDIDSIPYGSDFQKEIDENLSICDFFIAIIGPKWMGQSGEGKRIDDPNDFVRMEVSSALKKDITIIPLLISNTSMPTSDDLPNPIKKITRINAIKVDEGIDFEHHIDRLKRQLEKQNI